MDDVLIFEKLRTIIKRINGSAVITKETALVGESVLDSLEFMNYVTKVEEAFNISITDSEIIEHQLGILANMVSHINSRINNC